MPQAKLDITADDAYELFLVERRRDIVARLAAAAARSGRDASEVGMLAVSKTVEPEAVLRAWRAGWRAFAENRPQELARKLSFVEQQALPEMEGRASTPSATSRRTRSTRSSAGWGFSTP